MGLKLRTIDLISKITYDIIATQENCFLSNILKNFSKSSTVMHFEENDFEKICKFLN
jgi:hypothetical protein